LRKVDEEDLHFVWQTAIWLCYEEMELCVSGRLHTMTDHLETYIPEDKAAAFKTYIWNQLTKLHIQIIP
jgi:hypothetical protein